MKKLDFYDVKVKEKFSSSKWVKKTKMVKGRKRYFAVADAPSGIKSWRVISKSDYDNN